MRTTTLAFDIIAKDRASDKFDNLGKSTSGASDKLKNFAKVGAVAAAAGAVMAGKALVDMTKAAIEDAAGQKKLETALKNAAGATDKQVASTEKWISAQGKALGIADDDLRPALSKLALATGDVGKAQKLTALAMDISAGSGKSLNTVTEALQKAQNGSLGGLSRLGVATKNADGSTKSLKQVTKELADLHGGQAAAAAGTTEGKFKRLKLQFDEAKESIGAKLIPVAEKLADWLMNKLAPAAQKVGEWFMKNLMPPLRDFAERVGPIVADRIESMKKAFENAKPFIELVGKIVTNVLLPGLAKLLEIVGPVLNKSLEAMGKALGAIGEAGILMWNNALQPAFKFMANAIGTILGKLGDMFSALGSIKGAPDWIGKTGAALQAAAEKARAVADGINKIPEKKTVSIFVNTYQYSPGQVADQQSKGKGGAGKAGDPRMLAGANKRVMPGMPTREEWQRAGEDNAKQADEAMKKVRDKMKAKWEGIVGDARSSLDSLKSSMASMASSIGSAFNKDVFGGNVEAMMGGLNSNGAVMQRALEQFEKLKQMGASTPWLTALFQSGNSGLINDLANGSAEQVQTASALFGNNTSLAQQLGDAVAKNDHSLEIAAAVRELRAEQEKAPKRFADELGKVINKMELVMKGGPGGQKIYLQTGGWN